MPWKIMVIDHDPDIVKYLVDIFADHGYATCQAMEGPGACETAMSERPDLIILDLEMPEEWGPRIHKRLTGEAQFAHTPMVLISGLPGIHMAVPGAVATVRKPFAPEELLGIVRNALFPGPPA